MRKTYCISGNVWVCHPCPAQTPPHHLHQWGTSGLCQGKENSDIKYIYMSHMSHMSHKYMSFGIWKIYFVEASRILIWNANICLIFKYVFIYLVYTMCPIWLMYIYVFWYMIIYVIHRHKSVTSWLCECTFFSPQIFVWKGFPVTTKTTLIARTVFDRNSSWSSIKIWDKLC